MRRLLISLSLCLFAAAPSVVAAKTSTKAAQSQRAGKAAKKKATAKSKKKATTKDKKKATTKDKKKKKTFKIKKNHITLYHTHTHEKLEQFKIYDTNRSGGLSLNKKAYKKLKRFFRDPKTGKQINIDEKLIMYLYRIGQKFDEPIEIVSAYRPQSRKTSRHYQG
ncbi:DUF882 domain-containing protein, partial [Myxococcota bacterium]|nr:DUF882 domain-containing protein [Myxococcota bacterium]